MTDQEQLPPLWVGLSRLGLRILVIAVVVFAIHMVMNWATARAEAAGREGLMLGVLTALLLAYAILIAIPFMPGIEIGISLLFLKGASIAPLTTLSRSSMSASGKQRHITPISHSRDLFVNFGYGSKPTFAAERHVLNG